MKGSWDSSSSSAAGTGASSSSSGMGAAICFCFELDGEGEEAGLSSSLRDWRLSWSGLLGVLERRAMRLEAGGVRVDLGL